ncbi:MAG: FIST N-terminal domain-containing protein [Candidatus Omnitrophota bacterium]
MSSSIAIGFSQAEDPQEAAYQASMIVKNQMNSHSIDMAILFVSIHYAKPEILDVIKSILNPTRLVGSSTAGIILSHGIFNRGLAILAINSSSVNFGIGSALYSPEDNPRNFGFELGRKISLDLKSSFLRQASVILCDGLFQYNNQFILGARESLGYSFPLAGAFACDNFKLKETFQFHQKEIYSNAAVGLLIGSDNHVAFSNKHVFKPLGKPRVITVAEGHIIRTVDHKPAISIYEEYLKDDAINLKNVFSSSPAALYPLGIYVEKLRQYLLRYPVDILSDGSIVCQADIPQDSEVHLTISNKDSFKNAATAAAQEVKEALGGHQAKLLIIFESMIRHKMLGRHSLLEIHAIREILGYSTPMIGMYSFGELCPLGLGDSPTETYLQNGSILLLAIS